MGSFCLFHNLRYSTNYIVMLRLKTKNDTFFCETTLKRYSVDLLYCWKNVEVEKYITRSEPVHT